MESIAGKSIRELTISHLSSEEACIQFFIEVGLLKSDVCGVCSHKMSKINDSKAKTKYIYYCLACRKKVNPCRNTWFTKNKLSFSDNLLLIYCWAHDLSVELAVRETQLSRPTVIDYFYFIRQVCTDCINDNREVIGGPGVEVEIDESLFYRRKYNRGRILGSGWFFGAVERHDHSKLFLMVVPSRKKETLIPIIRERIARGSIIISDCWKAYNELSECRYIHSTVNHSQNFLDRQDRFIHTQNIENFWRWAKNASYPPLKIPKKDCPR
ncbi:putative transposase-like protein [Thelohanellus kitauei]|uniref:Putative transposase-like protein n=1 Tax=Thelohanellus kitauei TaxID=669202 RepID=A0A0C2JYD2_THEKT|nr:putative transposase-like protein [Thelohanellus kitauei]